MKASKTPATVALIGVRGYGSSYLPLLAELGESREVTFVAGCDINSDAGQDLPDGTQFYTDHREMLRGCSPDVTIVASPPHTHFEMARAAMEAGSDVMLEKPPVVSAAQHEELLEVSRRHGRICQVGFQGLVAEPMVRLLDLISDGEIGEVTDITVTAQWIRLDRYYERSRWAGHRRLDGVVVADGTATNPLAHPVMNALAIAQAADHRAVPVRMDVEAYRCREINTDDTLSARIHLGNGKRIHVAMTLCAEEHVAPLVTVYGARATAELGETATTLSIDGKLLDLSTERGRPLQNFLAHRRDPDRVPLRAALSRTAVYTAFLEGMLNSGDPHRIPAEFLDELDEDGTRRVILRGIKATVEAAGRQRALFSELGEPWARRAVDVPLSVVR